MPDFLDKRASLTPFTQRVVCQQATEPPDSGQYNTPVDQGRYLCRRCGLALFAAHSQFKSGCGWPAFDAILPNEPVRSLADPDGLRVEVRCSRCEGHLGHVFEAEGFTPANRRYCINSASIDWVASNDVCDSEEAILAGGCFWGVAYYLQAIPGVLKVEAGYTGGHIIEPSYNQVCSGDTGHYEAVRVVYDRAKTDYALIVKRFFEIHNPGQANGQGPDHGEQYRSAVFYYNNTQYTQTSELIAQLQANDYAVTTHLLPVTPFWPAEAYHQNYYARQQQTPYCHAPVARFLK